MASTRFFFLGFEVDDDLANRLSHCAKSDKTFLEKPEYLERLVIDGKPFLGRRLDGGGIAEATIEDSSRNVASLIKRVAPGWTKSPFHGVLTSVEEEIVHSDVVVNY